MEQKKIPGHQGQQARHYPDPAVNGGEGYGEGHGEQRCPCGMRLRRTERGWVLDPTSGWA